METLRDDLLKESTALLSITTHIRDFLAERLSERTYLVETESFFAYISNSLEAIQAFVEKSVATSATCGDALLSANLRDIKGLELVVRHMYRLVRQVCDADTLAIPFPILSYINSIMTDFPDSLCVHKSRILLLASDEFNFLHHRLDAVIKVCRDCDIVPDFPADVGVIAFPYTERNSICLNSLLFHELGHYVFQKASVAGKIETALHDLVTKIEKIANPGLLFANPVMKTMAKQRILSWCNELFADLLAVTLVGPSYALAFDRLVRLTGSDPKQQTIFSDRHPSDLYRKKAIAELLISDDWISALERVDVSKTNARVLTSLRAEATKEVEHEYPLENHKLSKLMLDSFFEVVPMVKAAVSLISDHLPKHVDDLEKNYSDVSASLLHLTVPSIDYNEDTGAVGPSPVVVLICGSLLLGQELKEIFDLTNRKSEDMQDRLWVEERISRLVMKGMEDALVLNKWVEL